MGLIQEDAAWIDLYTVIRQPGEDRGKLLNAGPGLVVTANFGISRYGVVDGHLSAEMTMMIKQNKVLVCLSVVYGWIYSMF